MHSPVRQPPYGESDPKSRRDIRVAQLQFRISLTLDTWQNCSAVDLAVADEQGSPGRRLRWPYGSLGARAPVWRESHYQPGRSRIPISCARPTRPDGRRTCDGEGSSAGERHDITESERSPPLFRCRTSTEARRT